MDKNVFIFWDGPKKPNIIKVLHNIMRIWSNSGANYNLKLYDATTIKEVIDVPDNITKFNWANQSDYYRTHLIAKFGGIWLDSDMIVMDDLSSLFDLIEKNDAFFVQEDRKHLSSGCFGAKKNHPAVVRWAEKTKTIVESGSADDWGSLGPLALTEVYKEGLIDPKSVLFGPYNVYPIPPGLIGQVFALNQDFELIVRRPWQPVFTLVHTLINAIDEEISCYNLLVMPTIYSLLLRESITKASKIHGLDYANPKVWNI